MKLIIIGSLLFVLSGFPPVKKLDALDIKPQIFAYPYYSVLGIWNGISNYKRSDLSSARICHYYGISKKEERKHKCHHILHGNDLFKSKYFVVSKNYRTVLYIHGFDEGIDSTSVEDVINAYLESSREYNVLILDWKLLATGNYGLEAARNAEHLSHLIADLLLSLFMNNNFLIENFHIVGHSLGAHLGGMIGRSFMTKTHNGLKIKRITGLDPSFPLFYPPVYKHISKTDAEFVDIIHTDAWVYGAPKGSGTIDFWPNKGKGLQPGCPPRDYRPQSTIDLCSHNRAWMYWAESVRYEFSFPSLKCLSYIKFTLKLCPASGKRTYMGIDCDLSSSGEFYLQTNDRSPFNKGVSGTAFEFSGFD